MISDSEAEKEQERAEEQWERLDQSKRDQVDARLVYITEVAECDMWMFAHAPDPEPLPPDPPDGWDEDADEDDVPHYDTPGGW